MLKLDRDAMRALCEERNADLYGGREREQAQKINAPWAMDVDVLKSLRGAMQEHEKVLGAWITLLEQIAERGRREEA